MIQLIAILSLAIYGSLISLLVGLKHHIAKLLNIDDAKAGGLFSAFMFTGAISVILLSLLIDIAGHKTIICFGFGFSALSLILLSVVRNYKHSLMAYILTSIGAMCIISVGNTLLPLVLFNGANPSAAANLGNGFYGAGAFLTSFFLSDMLKKNGYRNSIIFFAILMVVTSVLSLTAEFPVVDSDFSFGKLPQVLAAPAFIIAAITNFFGAGAENGVSSWANTYMSRLGANDKSANRTLSSFFIAVMVSRLLTATFVTPENTPVVLGIYAFTAALILLVMIVGNSRKVASAGILLLGLALGSACPNIFGYMFSEIDPSFHGTAFGIIFSIGLLGGSVVPYLVGKVSKYSSLRKGYAVNLVSAVLFGICALIMIVL